MTHTLAPHAGTTLAVPHAIVRHGDVTLAEVADLTLEPGRPVTVVGESGSGKSVLAHALMGTLPPELTAQGSMVVGDERFDLADRGGRRALWGRRLALLPQEPVLALDPTMRVRGQVAEGVRGWRPRDRTALSEADARLDRLGLGHAGRAWPHELSGGMAQRVAYAAATIGGAEVLIVDEPSKGLDPESLDRLAVLLEEHVATGGLLLTITHDLQLARRLGGEVHVMRDATVLESGPAAQVLAEPRHDYTRALLAAEPARWAHPWVRREPAAADVTGDVLVAAYDVAKAYAGTPVLEDLSMQVRSGERWALTGPSGAGKTTAGNALLGLTRIDAGRIDHAPEVRGRVQKLYQDPTLSFPQRVPIGAGLDDVCRRHGATREELDELLEQVGLRPALLERRPGQVSGGELQRIAIVRAMLTDPMLVFADEPTSRLDLLTQETTFACLMDQVERTGCALLLVTHDAGLAGAVADRRLHLGGQEVLQR